MAEPSARPVHRTAAPPTPLTDRERDELQQLLDAVPAPLEPLDVSMLDGFLCAVLVQPEPVPRARWLAHVTDVDGRALPAGFDARRLHALVERRHEELQRAIETRQWFDPWVFELAPETPGAPDEDDEPSPTEAVYPWVAGFATALELYPGLMALDPRVLNEPLALVYQHLAADDLEDAEELLAEIETLEPPEDLSEAVESLVRAVLLLADISRPVPAVRPDRRGRATRRR